MAKKIIFLLCILVTTQLGWTQDKCQYYLDLEIEKDCSNHPSAPSHYLTKYGFKFCLRFEQKLDYWPEPLRAFSESTRDCLQEHLRINSPDLTCREIERTAFASHSSCYYASGFCQLNKKHQAMVILSILDLQLLKKLEATSLQGYKVLKACSKIKFATLYNLHERLRSRKRTVSQSASQDLHAILSAP